MINQFQYQLDKSSKKFICPGCGKKRFVRYIDFTTKQYLPEKYGRCDRDISCGYFQHPYKDKFGIENKTKWHPKPSEPIKPISFFDPEVLDASCKAYESNNFISYLRILFDESTVSELIDKFKLGTSKHWPGATIFWQLDQAGRIRSGKVMLFDFKTGKRVKYPFNHITWAHKAMGLENFNLEQCYFGEHQIMSNPTMPIAIVESEKTAVVASTYLQKYIWLAAGSLTNLNIRKFKSLAGKKVVLWPDLKCLGKWRLKASELIEAYPKTNIIVSDFLEKNATPQEKEDGLDLADYLVKFNYHDFINDARAVKSTPADILPIPEPVVEVKQAMAPAAAQDNFKTPQLLKVTNWDKEIIELEQFFKSARIPTDPIKINRWSTITDVARYLESEFATVWANNGNRTFLPALNRLKELKQFLCLQQA